MVETPDVDGEGESNTRRTPRPEEKPRRTYNRLEPKRSKESMLRCSAAQAAKDGTLDRKVVDRKSPAHQPFTALEETFSKDQILVPTAEHFLCLRRPLQA
jgi:hypothetical protein